MENQTTEDTNVPTNDSPVGEVVNAEGGAAGVGEFATNAEPLVDSNAAATTGVNTSAEPNPLAAGGTTVDVTQARGQTVNSDVQNGNQLATGNVLVNDAPVVDAPALDGETKTLTNVENDLNPLVPPAGAEGAPASQLAAQAAEPEVEPLPRESHLMLLEAKFGSALAKLRNAERLALDELEAIYAHVKAVL